MINHEGISGEKYTCAGCKRTIKTGSYYYRIGNDIYCGKLCIKVSGP